MLAPIALFLSIVGLILIAAYLSRCFGRYGTPPPQPHLLVCLVNLVLLRPVAHTDEVPGVQVQEEGEAEERYSTH